MCDSGFRVGWDRVSVKKKFVNVSLSGSMSALCITRAITGLLLRNLIKLQYWGNPIIYYIYPLW